MHRNLLAVSAFLTVTLAACGGSGTPTSPSGSPALSGLAAAPSVGPSAAAGGVTPSVSRLTSPTATLPAECATVDAAQNAIDSLLPQLFKPGAGKRGKAQGYSNVIVKARRDGDTTTAKLNVQLLISFTLSSYFSGDLIGGQSTDTQARVLKFIYLLYCSNGISPVPDLSGIFASSNTVFITSTTPDTIVRDDQASTKAALLVRQGDVPSTIFGTYVSVVPTTNALPTSLDWYGLTGFKSGAFEFVANPAVNFTTPVLSGVCISYDDAVVQSPGDLRLAHGINPASPPPAVPGNTVLGSIEILARVATDPLGLACPALPLPVATLERTLRRIGGFFLPQELSAAMAVTLATGGTVGGKVTSLSPFAAVDIRLTTSATSPASPQYIPVGSTTVTAPASLKVATRKGLTPVSGVGVTFAPSTFSPATGTTDANGVATSTWTLSAGSNTGSATPALAPLVFTPSAASFGTTAVQVQPVTIPAQTPPAGTQGVAYGPYTFTAAGGIGTFTWAVVTGALPAGLTLSTAGVLSGTPTVAGSFPVTVRASSGPAGVTQTADASFTLVISTPPVDITTLSLPAAQRGVAYSAPLTATGGNGTYVWSLTAGSLPDGLSLAGNVISGTPSATANSASFTVRAASDGKTDTQALSITVTSPSSLTLTFEPGPSGTACYALNTILSPTIGVRVRDQAGRALGGVRVDLVAQTNNGAKVLVSQPFAISGADGLARFNTLSINKTGGYRLVATTTTPWPAATASSGRFTISPSCP